MSTRRIPKEAGFIYNESALPKGPNGRNLCRECATEVPKGRRTFCSGECVHEWKCRTNPTYQRQQVFKRDQGICVDCGRDCRAEEKELKRLSGLTGWHVQYYDRKDHTYRTITPDMKKTAELELVELLERNNATRNRRSLWDMDHVKPVVEGGGSCGLDNLRTLCIPCHKRATKELAGRRAAERKRLARLAADPQAGRREE